MCLVSLFVKIMVKITCVEKYIRCILLYTCRCQEVKHTCICFYAKYLRLKSNNQCRYDIIQLLPLISHYKDTETIGLYVCLWELLCHTDKQFNRKLDCWEKRIKTAFVIIPWIWLYMYYLMKHQLILNENHHLILNVLIKVHMYSPS